MIDRNITLLYYKSIKKLNVSKKGVQILRNNLIQLRGNKSRKQVAEELNITPQMLGLIERSSRNPSLELAINMAKLYNISMDKLIYFLELDTNCVSNKD